MKYIKKIHNSYSFNPSWGKIVSQLDLGIFESFRYEDGEDYFYFQYIKRDIAKEVSSLEENIYFDIITPFDYGGFYYTSERVLEKGLRLFEQKCHDENIISGFYRINPLLKHNNIILEKYMNIIELQEHIYIPLDEDYKKYFSANKRRDINRADRFGCEFIIDDSIDNFYHVYIESMDRINANEYFKFSKSLLADLVTYGNIFSIKYDGKVVNSVFVIVDEDDVYYFLGSGLNDYLEYGFNSLLLSLICEYYQGSKKIFYLGGGKDGLYQYKKRFSPKRVPFYIGKKIYNQDIYSKIVSQTNKQNNDFFPKYREKII